MGCLYKLTSPSKKSYIGVTKKTAEARWAKHKEHALGKRDAGALYSALRKYGPDSFTLQVLIISDDWEKLLSLEKEMIRLHQTLSPHGYNISEGGQGGVWHPTEKFRENCSIGQKKRYQRPEERERLLAFGAKARAAMSAKWKSIRDTKRAAQKAYVSSDAFKRLHSDSIKLAMARPEVKEKMLACAHQRSLSPEWRKKIAASVKKLWENPEYRAARAAKHNSSPQLSLPLE